MRRFAQLSRYARGIFASDIASLEAATMHASAQRHHTSSATAGNRVLTSTTITQAHCIFDGFCDSHFGGIRQAETCTELGRTNIAFNFFLTKLVSCGVQGVQVELNSRINFPNPSPRLARDCAKVNRGARSRKSNTDDINTRDCTTLTDYQV